MVNDIAHNRFTNCRNLLTVRNITLSKFCRQNSLSYDYGYELLGPDKRTKDMSDKMARSYEQAFSIEPHSLDCVQADWAREAAAAKIERMASITRMLADPVSINRYWNLRKIMVERDLCAIKLSELTGVHAVHCRKFGSDNPSMVISNLMVARLEAGLKLESGSLSSSTEKIATGEAKFPVTPDAVKFIGLGPYLYRYGHMRHFIQENGVKQSHMIKVPAFSLKGYFACLGDTPTKLVSTKMARAFESHFGLEPGSIERPVAGYHVEPDHAAFRVTEAALNTFDSPYHLNRYVNVRRQLFVTGNSLSDLAGILGKHLSTLHLLLSDEPTSKISYKAARAIESSLGLEQMSLDLPAAYRMASEPPPVDNSQKASRAISGRDETDGPGL